MGDLTITRLCAEAACVDLDKWNDDGKCFYFDSGVGEWGTTVSYDPLHDDAQCFALVKNLRLDCILNHSNGLWLVRYANAYNKRFMWEPVANDDLNRAVCECVARMQEAKDKSTSMTAHQLANRLENGEEWVIASASDSKYEW